LRHAQAGGTERYLDQLAAALAERGDEVHIVCRTHERAPHPGVRFVPLRGFALGRGHRLWRFARAVERHVAAERYDVVYGLGRSWSQDIIRLGGGTWALYLERAMAADRPRWQRLLGRDALTDRICLQLEQRALGPGGTPLVVCNSALIAREIQSRYATAPERIRIIPNAVDTARFTPELRRDTGAGLRRDWGFDERHEVALFLGSNYRRKGLDRVLTAFAAVVADHPQARLAVVGYDRDLGGWQRRAADLGLAEHCHFAGGRRDAEVCYAAADLYLLPTRYDPFANTTIEALASGLPVITTDGNGGCEVLDAHTGSVIPHVGGADELQAALRRWLAPGVAETARTACRATAEANRLAVGLERSLAVIDEAAARRTAAA